MVAALPPLGSARRRNVSEKSMIPHVKMSKRGRKSYPKLLKSMPKCFRKIDDSICKGAEKGVENHIKKVSIAIGIILTLTTRALGSGCQRSVIILLRRLAIVLANCYYISNGISQLRSCMQDGTIGNGAPIGNCQRILIGY